MSVVSMSTGSSGNGISKQDESMKSASVAGSGGAGSAGGGRQVDAINNNSEGGSFAQIMIAMQAMKEDLKEDFTKKMKEGFKAVEERLTKKMDEGFKQVNDRLDAVEGRLETLENAQK